jgi:hypothetical protein
MGVLYARVAGAWVPSTTGGGSVPEPAYVGPWRNGASTTDPNTAQFGNTLGGQRKEGLMLDASGYLRFYSRTGAPTGGSQTQFIEVSTDHLTETWIASLIRNRFQLGDFNFGLHPTHGMWCVWMSSEGDNYMVMRGTGGGLLLNANTGSSEGIHLRKGNSNMMTLNGGANLYTGNFSIPWTSPSNAWGSAHFLAYPQNNGADQARYAGHSPGVAPQLRVVATNGSTWGVVNEDSGAWAIIGAAGFSVQSSRLDKREVTTLGDKIDVQPLFKRERIIVNYSPRCDKVPPPDIMSLRPVTFRPKVPMWKIVPTKGDTYDPADESSWRLEPQTGIFGLEGTRERLGLVAEEVETVIPSAVNHNIDGEALGIDYAQITVALLDHVQRLTDEVATLRYRIAELENV